MKPGLFQQLILYRYRYAVGYTLFILFGVAMLVWQLPTLGPGLAEAEKHSALQSATWQWQNWKEAGLQIVDLPYLLAQKASISIFGLSVFSVRLPSVVIGLATSALFFWMMRLLHRSHIALAASVLFAAGSWYIAIGRFGTPLVMIPFIWVLMTYSFVRLIRLDDPPLGWAAVAALASTLALYTPYGAYAIVSAVLVLAVHPTVRRSVSALTGQQVVLGLFILIPLLTPLAWGVYKDPAQALPLLGVTTNLPNPPEFFGNIAEALVAVFLHAPELPQLRLSNLPLLSVGVSALLLAGMYQAIVQWRSMRSQYILCSLLILLVMVGLHPDTSYAVLIVPLFLLVASGITVLFREWYRLFPRNPYARSFGLIPIVIFLSLIVVYHYQRYFVAWANSPRTYQVYDNDISLVRTQAKAHPNLAVVVPANDAALYKILARKYPHMSINPTAPASNQPLLMSGHLPPPDTTSGRTLSPITNDDSKQALRFWLIESK